LHASSKILWSKKKHYIFYLPFAIIKRLGGSHHEKQTEYGKNTYDDGPHHRGHLCRFNRDFRFGHGPSFLKRLWDFTIQTGVQRRSYYH